MRILMVEDDHATAQSVELMMKSEGFNVYTTDLAEEGVDLAKIYDYDLVLMDINLPDFSGIEAVKQIRAGGVKTPIMMLTGSERIENKVAAFAAGCDDYLTKPFHKDELICRVRAIIRRSKGHASASVVIGGVTIHLDAKTVEVDGRRVHLTGKEYQMLELLALRKGTTLSKEQFLNHLYGGMDEPELKIIDVFICKLRRKLSEAGGGLNHIETVWGRGYRMVDEPIAKSVLSYEAAPGGAKVTPQRDRLSTARGQVLAMLATIGAPVQIGTVAAKLGTERQSLQSSVSLAHRDGLIEKSGPHGQRKYAPTAKGMEWLKASGWVAPETAKAA